MKRVLLIALGVALLLPVGSQAQGGGTQWTCSLDNQTDAITLCIVAPEPGMRRYITDIIAQSTTASAGLFNVVYAKSVATGGAANCGDPVTVTLFPSNLASNTTRYAAAANSLPPTLDSPEPYLVVPTNKDICITGDAAGNNVTVQLIGYVAP